MGLDIIDSVLAVLLAGPLSFGDLYAKVGSGLSQEDFLEALDISPLVELVEDKWKIASGVVINFTGMAT